MFYIQIFIIFKYADFTPTHIEAHTASQLRITDYRDKVNARLSYQSLNSDDLDRARSQNDLHKGDKNDEYAILVCNAQSQPLPVYTWFRVQSNGQRTPVTSILDLNSNHKRPHAYLNNKPSAAFNNSIDNSLQKQSDSLSFNLEQTNRAQSFKYIQWAGVLFIRHFNLRDDGLYTCVVNNTFDEERLDTRLSIQGTFDFLFFICKSMKKSYFSNVLYQRILFTYAMSIRIVY